MIIFPITLIFLYYFFNQRFLISSIFLALAISLKIFPALLLFLFFQKKLFKYALVTISWCTGIFFLSIFLLNIKLQSVFQIFSSVIKFFIRFSIYKPYCILRTQYFIYWVHKTISIIFKFGIYIWQCFRNRTI